MFDTRQEAEAALRCAFDPAIAAAMASALIPAVIIKPTPDAPTLGGTRLGGAPDMPRDMTWPSPPAVDVEATVHRIYGDIDSYTAGVESKPEDVKELLRRSYHQSVSGLRKLLGARVPYAFLAQIDLSSAHLLGSVTSPLPSEGRLLFFYDFVLGFRSPPTPDHARVIWDPSPLAERAAAEMPQGVGVTSNEFGSPSVPAVLASTLRLPDVLSVDINDMKAIWRAQGADESSMRERYIDFLEGHMDLLWMERWRRNQVLGSPLSEQDDPRYDVVANWELGRRWMRGEEFKRRWGEIEARATAWRLLLQIDLGELGGWEGSVYFLIRRCDLAAARFEKVVPVYQQT